MRSDAKLGIVASLILVGFASWYFSRDAELSSGIPISTEDTVLPLSASPSAADPSFDDSVLDRTETAVDEDDGASFVPDRLPVDEITQVDDDETEEPGVATAAGWKNGMENITGGGGDEADESLDRSALGVFGLTRVDANVDKTIEADSGDALPLASGRKAVGAEAVPVPEVVREPFGTDVRFESHTVQPGDTVVQIARMYYGDERYVRVILDANPELTDTTNIKVGTKIQIPDVEIDWRAKRPSASDQPSKSGQRTYTIKQGDSLFAIARDHLSSGPRWREIFELNRDVIGNDWRQLPVGQVLKLPPG